ncbi:nectin-4 [Denticeps clupeoides]|uniref:Ig-like domain-containing protein n=1 Tax=Denticeps clupeoides TaxID=299321 RepID=A0AAY4A0C2_9TELE|nr:nectin-4-like [Denticeps clupeoides]
MMLSVSKSLSKYLWICGILTCIHGEFIEPLGTPFPLRSLLDGETRLPCRYKAENLTVVQVSWIREKTDGKKETIITAHYTEGHKESPEFVGKALFESPNPIQDSTLLILRTRLSDEATYTCQITTFPSGKVEVEVELTVWSKPISNVDAVVMVEGQSFRQAAYCRANGRPPPHITWDTDLAGNSENRSLEEGSVSSQFSLHPLRHMNGRKLDCLVWHPLFETPHRIRNTLVVHFPPDASVLGYGKNWYVGKEGAELKCESGGNPRPQSFTWSRKGGTLPEGVVINKESLKFNHPLTLMDSGIYECVSTNVVGSGRAEVAITIDESRFLIMDNIWLLIIGGAAVALLIFLVIIVIVVVQYHKRKNKKLVRELEAKKEEISTLSRQASFRRTHSGSTENRYHIELEETYPLRVEGTLRNSLSSLDRPRSRDSRSTLGGAVDSLGRPAIYNTSRRGRERMIERDGEESRHRVDSFVSHVSLSKDNQLHPPLQPSPFIMEQSTDSLRPSNGKAIIPAEARPRVVGGSSSTRIRTGVQRNNNYPPVTDEEEDEDVLRENEVDCFRHCELNGLQSRNSDTNSQISEAMSNHFEQSNGVLMPKSSPNSILIPPQSPNIHRPQIV